jgi:hypothetical protein
LTLSGLGSQIIELNATSETKFSAVFGGVRFEKDEHGEVTDIIVRAVEGDFKAPLSVSSISRHVQR